MKIFVCEFITGGGLYRDALPPSLAREGSVMLDAILRDLSDRNDLEVYASRDVRLPPLSSNVRTIWMRPGEDPWHSWHEQIALSDAVWPIAPESGGVLLRLSRMARDAGKLLIGSSPEAIALASSKRATIELLQHAGIPVVPTHTPQNMPLDYAGAWVAKPDDGVGCEDTAVFDTRDALLHWLSGGRMTTHVVQPFTAGEAASLSMLCYQGVGRVLSCNRQLIQQESGRFRYHGSFLNEFSESWQAFDEMARAVAAAVPGLAGYAGMDMILTEDGPRVLEINPRLTTSYGGLRQAIGDNPSGIILDMLYNRKFFSGPIQRNRVELRLDE